MWLAARACAPGSSNRQVAIEFQLGSRTIDKFVNAWKMGRKLFEKGGRPPLIDKKMNKELMEMLEQPNFQITTSVFVKTVNEKVMERARNENRVVGQFQSISKRSVGRFRKANNVKRGDAEEITEARRAAIACPRNAVTFAAMNAFMVPKCDPCCIWNLDATQFQVGDTTEERVEVMYIEKPDGKPLKAEPVEDGDYGSGMHFFIKYYLLMTASGQRADPVYLIADCSLKEEEFYIYQISGLGIATTDMVQTKGWLAICKTRGGNAAFYKWLNTAFIVPTAQMVKENNDLPAEAPVWLQLDGEAIQIGPYEDPDVLQLLAANFITVGKPPASTTAITQPCDAGNCFKAAKTKLRALHDSDVDTKSRLYDKVNQVLLDHTAARKEKYIEKHGCATGFEGLKSTHKKFAVLGLLRVQKALNETMKSTTISESFRKTGIYPFNFQTIMRNCTTALPIRELDALQAVLPQMSALFQQKGEVTDADMTALGVRAPKSVKDKLIVSRRRAIILTDVKHIAAQKTVAAAKATKPKRVSKPVTAPAVPPPPLPAVAATVVAAPVVEVPDGERANKRRRIPNSRFN